MTSKLKGRREAGKRLGTKETVSLLLEPTCTSPSSCASLLLRGLRRRSMQGEHEETAAAGDRRHEGARGRGGEGAQGMREDTIFFERNFSLSLPLYSKGKMRERCLKKLRRAGLAASGEEACSRVDIRCRRRHTQRQESRWRRLIGSESKREETRDTGGERQQRCIGAQQEQQEMSYEFRGTK